MSLKILFIDPIGGLSGDMFLGAFLDLGLPVELLRIELEKVGLGRFFEFEVEVVERHQIAARKINFPILPEALVTPAPKTMGAVETLLAPASLPAEILAFTLKVFRHLAVAEAKVHGSSVSKVHFHEVGNYDTIADIVGVATAINWLKPQALRLKPVPLGSGSVDCAHGSLPVPVPAVMALLEDIVVVESGIESELVTPTGAAILKTLVELFPPFDKRVCKLGRSGYGAGSRKLIEKPNLLRLSSGSSEDVFISDRVLPYALETLVTLETIIDDMTPEKLAFLKDRLLGDGALDVISWSLFMKKGRLGNNLLVLVKPALETKIVNRIYAESSTLGIRRFVGERYFLEREIRSYQTSFGEIRCKIAHDKSGQIKNLKPEHDDLVALAQSHDLPLTRLEQLILAELATS